MEPAAVRRCRITLRIRDAEWREARVQLARRQLAAAGAFPAEDIELAGLSVVQAEGRRDLAALDLEESLGVHGLRDSEGAAAAEEPHGFRLFGGKEKGD